MVSVKAIIIITFFYYILAYVLTLKLCLWGPRKSKGEWGYPVDDSISFGGIYSLDSANHPWNNWVLKYKLNNVVLLFRFFQITSQNVVILEDYLKICLTVNNL